jgi:hypothetical protein
VLHGAALCMALTDSLRTQSLAFNAPAIAGAAFRAVPITAWLTCIEAREPERASFNGLFSDGLAHVRHCTATIRARE